MECRQRSERTYGRTYYHNQTDCGSRQCSAARLFDGVPHACILSYLISSHLVSVHFVSSNYVHTPFSSIEITLV